METFNIAEKLRQFKKKYPGIIATITIVTTFGTFFTVTNAMLGVQVRPAWHWEYEHLKDNFYDLKIEHQNLKIVILQRDLARFSSIRDGYIKKDEPVPDWLDEEMATIKAHIDQIRESIDLDQVKIKN